MDDLNDDKPFVTAADALGIPSAADQHLDGAFHRGLSFTPGLVEVSDSKVPGTGRSHMHGPQQSPVDPLAAGLETERTPLTLNENRAINRTGELGSGPRAGGEAVSDGSQVAAAADDQAPITPANPIKKAKG